MVGGSLFGYKYPRSSLVGVTPGRAKERARYRQPGLEYEKWVSRKGFKKSKIERRAEERKKKKSLSNSEKRSN